MPINMPETSDTDFSWREFVRRNNDELVATYGNLVHRVLTVTYRNFDGHYGCLRCHDGEHRTAAGRDYGAFSSLKAAGLGHPL